MSNNADATLAKLTNVWFDPVEYATLEHHWMCYNEWFNKYPETLNKVFGSSKEKVNCMLDLGANTGSITNLFFRYFEGHLKNIVCIEPNLDNVKYLKFSLNAMTHFALERNVTINWSIIQAAVFYSDKKTMDMKAIDDNVGGYFLSDVASLKNAPTQKVKDSVPLVSIEEIAKKLKIDYFDLVKIDIEGAEWNVLENSEFLKNNTGFIVMEIHDKTIEEATRLIQQGLPHHEILEITDDQFFLGRKA